MDADIFVSGKQKLRIQKYPDTCGRGLNQKGIRKKYNRAARAGRKSEQGKRKHFRFEKRPL